MSFDHQNIEAKWQKIWEEKKTFKATIDKNKPKYYALDMFPYPSSQGLHVGHPEGYTATDIVSRYKRARGFNVLHPMGWDAFGLPAEQYAIKTGVHPEITTTKAIENFKRQLKSFGFSYDWEREISTCDPKYYKWTQFIFMKLYEKGLAYQKEVPVNWCPALKTVLANEEVIDGKSERGGHPVVRMPMKQWMLKITSYAERLLADLDKVDWPERTKEAQKNWIGKSEGAHVLFSIENSSKKIEVFTTRPDTLFGATFIVLAPEHPLVGQITSQEQKKSIEDYQAKTSKKSEVDRQANKEKSGVFTGTFALNPLNGKKIPIWIADYVLMGYGTGAIMAVPAHDERDFEFANAHGLEITPVIQPLSSKVASPTSEEEKANQDISNQEIHNKNNPHEIKNLPFLEEGLYLNSEFLNGITSKKEAIQKINKVLLERNVGEPSIHYKFRDWLFSRQRYWGEPFPVIHYPQKGIGLVPENELPVLLPKVADYEPSETAESPLSKNKEWLNYKDEAKRETDTMPGSAGSSWYFLRYTDPNNEVEPFSFEAQDYWMPVDLYLGGPEHTVGHLLYSRFWQKVLLDCGLVTHEEPFQKLVHQGMILGEDGEKMSKSRGNVINPDDVTQKYGADALRIYLMFMGPLERDKPWQDTGIDGVKRFLDRLWRLCYDENSKKILAQDKEPSLEIKKHLHKTIKKVTEDIESLSFNTAISQMMIFLNDLYKQDERPKSALKTLAQLLMPFAPHLSEEIWSLLGGEELVSLAPWPTYDPKLVVDDTLSMGVQVNGKTRGSIELSKTATEEEAMKLAQDILTVKNALEGLTIQKVIFKIGKILNIIAK